MILDEIIQLKKDNGIDFGETYAEQLRHYKGALREGKLEYIVEHGKLTGFIEWLRLPSAPQQRKFSWKDYPVQRGEYLYILNTVCKQGDMWRLINMMKHKEKRYKYICYHNINNELKIKKEIK